MDRPKTARKTAIWVGILFIMADILLFAGEALYKPVLNATDFITVAHQNRLQVITGILIEFIGYLGLVFIPILLYPILKKYSEVLALGYIGFRLLEVVLLSVAQVHKLALLDLSHDYLKMATPDTSYYESNGNAIRNVMQWVNSDGLIYIIIFVVGTLLLNILYYRSKLVPRWISVWGLFAALVLLIASLMVTFNISISTSMTIAMIVPIGLQEIVMAIWLIAKGFNFSKNT